MTECVWTADRDGGYETSCGQAFVFTDGCPRENGARFCCYCGKPLQEKAAPLTEESTWPPPGAM